MYDAMRIHIKPGDYMADVDEIADGSEPRSRCRYYIEPYGPHGINEVCEANYFIGNKVPYHEHAQGFETFLVDGGSLEVYSQGKKAVAKKGDIVHIAPYTPHSIYILEDDTIWRAFHQDIYITRGIIDERRLRDAHPDLVFAPSFRQDMGARRKSAWFDYAPEMETVSADKLGIIRTFDSSLANFNFNGIEYMLKVGRWETNGAKEVWQFKIPKGKGFSWEPMNVHDLLYDVYSGSFEVKLEGMEPFVANTRDLLNIPKFIAGSITALEDSVMLDCGCRGFLLRLLEELHSYQVNSPEKLEDAEFVKNIMKKHDHHVSIV